jgi:hypothetical protein
MRRQMGHDKHMLEDLFTSESAPLTKLISQTQNMTNQQKLFRDMTATLFGTRRSHTHLG